MQPMQLHAERRGEVNIMAKTVTTRLDDGYVKKIDEMAARKGIDRSALLRSQFTLARQRLSLWPKKKGLK